MGFLASDDIIISDFASLLCIFNEVLLILRCIRQPINGKAVAEMAGESHDSRIILVAYASETGNSQDVAEELGGVAERLHFRVRVCELDTVDAVRTMISFSDFSKQFLFFLRDAGRLHCVIGIAP